MRLIIQLCSSKNTDKVHFHKKLNISLDYKLSADHVYNLKHNLATHGFYEIRQCARSHAKKNMCAF